eukprot:31354-Pelagococcus_subviridis.AAC.19
MSPGFTAATPSPSSSARASGGIPVASAPAPTPAPPPAPASSASSPDAARAGTTRSSRVLHNCKTSSMNASYATAACASSVLGCAPNAPDIP